jgi:hypothetical protein
MEHDEPLELTTLTKLTDGNLAEILKLALADEEIECVIEGEHQAGMTGIFKIRVLVPKKDLAQAEEVLQQHAGGGRAGEGQEDEEESA